MHLVRDTSRYKHLTKASIHQIPAELDWLKKVAQLSHYYRTTFFTLGSLYIAAFSIFCFYPAFNVSLNHPFFYILWIIIFGAIVVTFPLVSYLEYTWIKQIVKRVKDSYIFDLVEEYHIEELNAKGELKVAAKMTEWVFAATIQNTS